MLDNAKEADVRARARSSVCRRVVIVAMWRAGSVVIIGTNDIALSSQGLTQLSMCFSWLPGYVAQCHSTQAR